MQTFASLPLRAEDIAAALQTPLRGPPMACPATSLSTDTRTLQPGAVFVALRGPSFDGHVFLPAAQDKQMAVAVLDSTYASAQTAPIAVPHVIVEDTLLALAALARWVRQQHAGPVLAVTGSNGKTTTKELLAAALSTRGLVHRTHGNLNNYIGVPQTLMAWPQAAWAAVVEMGMSALGEISYLTQMAQPQVGLVTCVAEAHLLGLGTLTNVARAKAELFVHMPEGGICIINADDAALAVAIGEAGAAVQNRPSLRFGTQAHCDVRLLSVRSVWQQGQSPRLAVSLQVEGRVHDAELPLLGLHNGLNVAGAVAAAWAAGVAPAQALQGMADVRIPGGRLAHARLPQLQLQLIDDCYNANPGSMRAAFATLVATAQGARCTAVVGDMLELGADAPQLHEQIGMAAAKSGLQQLWAVGAHAADVVRGAAKHGLQASAYAHAEALIEDLLPQLRAQDWLLVKGSRGMRLERVVAALRQADAARTNP